MFHFPRYASSYKDHQRNWWGFPIRRSPDQRLIVTSPKHIADIPRPSSLSKAKASTIHPYIPVRNAVHRCTISCCKFHNTLSVVRALTRALFVLSVGDEKTILANNSLPDRLPAPAPNFANARIWSWAPTVVETAGLVSPSPTFVIRVKTPPTKVGLGKEDMQFSKKLYLRVWGLKKPRYRGRKSQKRMSCRYDLVEVLNIDNERYTTLLEK